MSDVRITNIPSSLYDLFFSLKVTEISKNDFYQLNNWVFDLHSFENDHIISFSVLNGDENDFYVSLELKNISINKNISFKENIYNLDKETKFRIFYEMHILNKHFNKVYDLLNKSNQINLNNDQFADFYLKTIPILKILNFKVDLPQNLKNMIKPRIISDVILKSNGVDREDLMNLENLVDFDWKIAIADKKISIKEFKKLLKKSSKFIEIGDKKYILNLDDVEVVSEKLDKIPKKFKNNQILQTLLISNNDDEFNIDEKILKLLDEIKNYKNVDIPDNLNGVLREYQYRGFSWLVQNTTFGFGSILADDMGLGKTLQVLTAILYFKNNNFLNDKKILVIAPTAILFNWQNEIEQFTPDLSFDIIHGANRTINPDIDVIISSYGMIRSNFDIFANINWFMIVVDEAQNIKNPSTKQSSFIKKLESNYKVALTGTPIENSLVDYWSIFDFTNKYYLEGLKNFKTNYLNPIEKDHDYSALEKFKAITSPFILRRLKTDEKIINDLPDKIVTECFTPLTEVQAALYQSTIDKTIDIIENSSGIERKGLVFKLINSLKQICNHPAHFTKSNKYGIDESGKMEMLVDILENTEENKEKIIIFTQFVQMGNIIVKLLEDKFKTNVMFYHGRLSRKKRDKIIKEFEDNPDKRILIVSLKAGGTGLNLTAANHVVHFDLWWNPAVENQATDRAFRIGQKSNVFVYRFITKGTFEENINRILTTKKELAEITIDKNEKFLTEMSNDELKTLIMLK
jgi:SNF2 family DNA or RNA helicase